MTRVLIIGGNRSTVGSIKAVRAAGFEVVVAEKLPRQDALAAADIGLEIPSNDVEGLDTAIRRLGHIDGIIGINEQAMQTATELQHRFGLIGLSEAVIDRTLSKLEQRKCWSRSADLAVDYRIAEGPGDVRDAVEAWRRPVIVKPDRSLGGSRGVSLVSNPDDSARAFDYAREQGLPGTTILVETALKGPQFSAELIVRDGVTSVLAIGRKVKSPEPYRVDLAISYPGVEDAADIAAIERMCSQATALLGISRGPGHIEFALTELGPRPIELAARCGGSITADLAAHVSGVHPMVEACKLACGVSGDLPSPRKAGGAVLMFLAFPPGSGTTLSIPDWVRRHPALLDIDARLPDDGRILPVRWTSQRSGYLGILADDGATARELAAAFARAIHVIYQNGEEHSAIGLEDVSQN
ncbi:MAG TPA: ATP-grasp domain-containing protein [Dongiaceae bacterium]|nr:ATP-grasp domain-containing protein [Dongiaceae bacterium]